MELLALRDMIQDNYGNYYAITTVTEKEITIVNYIVHSTHKRILNQDFLEDVNNMYKKSVTVGKFFTDSLIQHIKTLERPSNPGNIYKLEDVLKEFDVKNDPFYEREIGIK